MESNYRVPFDELSSELQKIIYDVIEKICLNIEKYSIDIRDLSKIVGMDNDTLMDYILNPKNDYSRYLDILDSINKLLGR